MSGNNTRLGYAELTGTPFEQGHRHGETFSKAIRTNLDTYVRWFDEKGRDLEQLLDHGRRYLDLIDRQNPEYVEEMEGIAEGSGIDLIEISMLNARYEAMYPANVEDHFSGVEPTPADGCSTFAVQPEVTADGKAYLGQNWDWLPDLVNVVLSATRDERPSMVYMTEAGIVGGKTGVNEHGIGLGVNGLFSPHDGEGPDRKPFHVRCREVLDAVRLDEALRPIISTDRVCSANFLLGHAEGEFIDLETSPEKVNYLYPTDGVLGHSNHFRDRSRIDGVSDRRDWGAHTLLRANRIERLLGQAAGEIDLEVMKAVWRDHFNYPGGSLCRHPDTAVGWKDRTQTNCSFIIDLKDRRMYGALGPPCEHEYQEYAIPS